MLAGVATEAQQFILTREILDYLGEGRPEGAGRPGEGLRREVPFAVSGPLVWALAQQDPAAAWSVLKSSTLASHAETYPERWFGIWSGPESLGPALNGQPGEGQLAGSLLSLGERVAPYSDFPIGDGASASHLLFALNRLVGLEPDAQGYHVRPQLPFRCFRFETARLGLRWQEDRVEGYLLPQGNDLVQIRVEYPEPLAGQPRAWVNRRPVAAQLSEDGRQVSFRTFVRGGLRTEWEVRAGQEGQE